jgi:hypothetical protein
MIYFFLAERDGSAPFIERISSLKPQPLFAATPNCAKHSLRH